ncbi:cupin domain-containing protein [Actinoplanes sp. Pm04-4]|uniref:Cupin domain-containing protein n=1 Tax=Paractinoplanes pyxinae TaxID=2997416 RepID=A0ABT4ASK2_9ACTN|nr:cupin domain-containing protein [Actinoplanes pyxinae]MCY1137216.1 cupin domain-containing protein [Actinoplanes pyxinae]
MRIVRQSDRGPGEQRMTVTGQVWFEPVLPATDGTTMANVTFSPGARTFWHSHEGGQVLQIVSGRGLICSDGGEPEEIRAGDVVWIPAGERHWHGAAADSPMTHLAISLGTTHWAEEVV